jgi:phage tail-like protein
VSNFASGLHNRITSATFLFEVDGQEIGNFAEVSGLEVSIETEDIQEGGQNGFVHKLPGRMTWPNIVLKRGVTNQNNLFQWLEKTSGEQFTQGGNRLERSTASITLTLSSGARLRAWNFDGAFPVKWTGPTFAADSEDYVSEELEITHHGFTVQDF